MGLAALAVLAAGRAFGQEAAPEPALVDSLAGLKVGIDTLWVTLAAMLVFAMNMGFALVESGLARAKNCVNILTKNFIVFAIASVSFYVIGWGLMFGDGTPWIGLKGLFCVAGADNSPMMRDAYSGVYAALNWTGVPLWTKFFFQLAFAGTAATIVSGAVAERIKFGSFLIFSLLLVAFMYPVTGHWIWGGGVLASKGFLDFAGSSAVHSVGGWAALTGAIILGPRLGKYRADGSVNPIPGHNMTSAALGAMILWLGWFGFNPGSTMAVGDGSAIAHVLVATNMAAVAGAVTAMCTAWAIMKKPDLSMILNGLLAGLVAVTAPCAFVSIGSSIAIGGIAGVLVVLGVLFFDRLKIDDPVGALSVHLLNGVWGTLCVGLFWNPAIAESIGGIALANQLGAAKQTLVQFQGVLLVGVFTVVLSGLAWLLLKYTLGIRVTREEEVMGLDIGEHGNEAYPDFQGFLTK
jgi:Amt family ammonium transporter